MCKSVQIEKKSFLILLMEYRKRNKQKKKIKKNKHEID